MSFVKSLIESRDGVHLTTYLENHGDLHALRAQLRGSKDYAYDNLAPVMQAPMIGRLLDPLDKLFSEPDKLLQMKGNVGIFRNQAMFRILNIPVHVSSGCHVASSFHVKPLLTWLQTDQEFLLITVTRVSDAQIEVSIYSGNRASFRQSAVSLFIEQLDASVESGIIDIVAFDLVTMGSKASEHSAKLFKDDNYTDYLLFHGLSVESAEAFAEMWHKRIREELGVADDDAPELSKLFHQGYRGSRYGFGYPACPNIADQAKLFELLEPARIDVGLTDGFMLDPEQSTSAIIVHHPEAKYFNIE